jgi:NNP family nitrate/nitrite transporter-like MFS transporter
VMRPLGGWMADRFGGARVTFWTFVAMIAGTLAVLFTLSQLTPNPTQDPAVAVANQSLFPWFLVAFLFIFAATGIGNGSTFRMIPAIWRRDTRQSSAVIGLASAVGAIGGFLIPLAFGAPWIDDPVSAVKSAFAVFAVFYGLCLFTTWFVYLRTAFTAKVGSLAEARV